MKRLTLAAVVAVIVIACAALAFSQRTRMARVGGARNACTCTQRIEP